MRSDIKEGRENTSSRWDFRSWHFHVQIYQLLPGLLAFPGTCPAVPPDTFQLGSQSSAWLYGDSESCRESVLTLCTRNEIGSYPLCPSFVSLQNFIMTPIKCYYFLCLCTFLLRLGSKVLESRSCVLNG